MGGYARYGQVMVMILGLWSLHLQISGFKLFINHGDETSKQTRQNGYMTGRNDGTCNNVAFQVHQGQSMVCCAYLPQGIPVMY